MYKDVIVIKLVNFINIHRKGVTFITPAALVKYLLYYLILSNC
jgi:hypothetical protein